MAPLPDHVGSLSVVAVALVVCVATAGAVGAGNVLTITDGEGTVLYSTPVSDGTLVTVEYTHSVEKTLVTEEYAVSGTTLSPTRMLFDSYGAGLPSDAAVERADDGRYVTYPEGSHEAVHLSPGPIAGHTLTVGEETVDLVELADGESVRISVEPRLGALPLQATHVV
ncbi:DUF1850 domain-containing protein [Natronorarus salvus]|uniref:DUF1850 domain-containing protein n=1 Tax=Natronorarus salvus TaxID=3117733 RepID=UPI002F25F005